MSCIAVCCLSSHEGCGLAGREPARRCRICSWVMKARCRGCGFCSVFFSESDVDITGQLCCRDPLTGWPGFGMWCGRKQAVLKHFSLALLTGDHGLNLGASSCLLCEESRVGVLLVALLTPTSYSLPELLDTPWHRTSAAYTCSCKRRLSIGITSQGKCASRSTWQHLPPFHPPSCKNDIYFYTKSVFSEPAFPLLNLPVCSVFSSFVTGSSLFYWAVVLA